MSAKRIDDRDWRCPQCGYDLRGSIERSRPQGKCPECGKAFQLAVQGPQRRQVRWVLYPLLALGPGIGLAAVMYLLLHVLPGGISSFGGAPLYIILAAWLIAILAVPLCGFWIGWDFTKSDARATRIAVAIVTTLGWSMINYFVWMNFAARYLSA